MVRISARWYRVYVMQWSNAGTAYVQVNGQRHLLGGYDPRTHAEIHRDDIAPGQMGPFPPGKAVSW